MVPYELLGDQDIACKGCRARRCPFESQPCLDCVHPDDVIDALERLVRPPVEALA
jgi:ADP-heptose:LPS heptosyltransferase